MKRFSKIFAFACLCITAWTSYAAAKSNPKIDAAKASLEKAFVAVGSQKCLVPNKVTMPRIVEPWLFAVGRDVKDVVDANADADGKKAYAKLDEINRHFMGFLNQTGTELKLQSRATFEQKLSFLSDNQIKLDDTVKKYKSSPTKLAKYREIFELLADLNHDLLALIGRAYNDSQRYDQDCKLKGGAAAGTPSAGAPAAGYGASQAEIEAAKKALKSTSK